MKSYKTIIVVLALDERDTTTLRHAAYFARATGSQTVYVVHVAPTFDLPPEAVDHSPELALPKDENIEHQLRKTFAEEKNHFPPSTQIEYVERQGSLAPELVRLAVQKSGDLICIGCRQQEEHDLLTNAAVDVLRNAPCSTLLIPFGAEPQYDRILVPIDFSEPSREALDSAVPLIESKPGSEITIVHVYGVPIGYHKTGKSYEEYAAIMKKFAEQEWEKILPLVNFKGIKWTIRFELSDKVPMAILSVAEEIDAQLIVMASHGRTRSAAVLLGHATDSVATKTKRPLFCIKKKGAVVDFLQALLQLFET